MSKLIETNKAPSPYSLKSVKNRLGKKTWGELLILFAFMLFFYAPLVYSLILAFGSQYNATDIVPSEWGFRWWAQMLKTPNMVSAVFNSFAFAICSTLLSMVICIPAAYVLARFKFPGRRLIMFAFLIGNAFPKIGMYSSIGVIYYQIGLMGTFLGVLLIHVMGSAMQMIWLPAGAFRSVPANQEEASRDAGAGPIRTFFSVTLPIAWPGIAVAAIQAFIASLGESVGTLMVGLPQYRTMMTEMYGIILDTTSVAPGAVFSVIIIVPNMILLFIMRRYLSADTLAKGFKMG
jgi:putative spermidine/putrescine transport system permease protein